MFSPLYQAVVLITLGLLGAGCSTMPSELRVKYKPSTTQINGNMNEVADCLMPYMDEVKFFITAEPRFAHKRILDKKIEIFAADQGYALYVIDIEGNGDKSVASLYTSNNFNKNNVLTGFENAAKECNKKFNSKSNAASEGRRSWTQDKSEKRASNQAEAPD